jgi:hypothetical protein
MKRARLDRVIQMLGANTTKESNMRALLLTGAALMVLVPAAMAQNANNSQTDNTSQTASSQHMRANLRNMLEKSGYKDIRVARRRLSSTPKTRMEIRS